MELKHQPGMIRISAHPKPQTRLAGKINSLASRKCQRLPLLGPIDARRRLIAVAPNPVLLALVESRGQQRMPGQRNRPSGFKGLAPQIARQCRFENKNARILRRILGQHIFFESDERQRNGHRVPIENDLPLTVGQAKHYLDGE